MKIGYLGSGAWGYCLATLLAKKGHDVSLWTDGPELAKILNEGKKHPKLPYSPAPDNLYATPNLEEVLADVDYVVESVTAQGIRPVFQQIHEMGGLKVPVIMTSKGIEQNSSLLLPEVLLEIFGEEFRSRIAYLSGPSHAEEVMQGIPTAVSCSAYDENLMVAVQELFQTPSFHPSLNSDLNGVALGGAMKNIIAIACGISDGLGFGDNTKAAVITLGFEEISRLAPTKKALSSTLSGFAGLGDLCVTCLSVHSRNYRFGGLIGRGMTPSEAQEKVAMVVEGTYTCISAVELGKKENISLPVTEALHRILYENASPSTEMKALLRKGAIGR